MPVVLITPFHFSDPSAEYFAPLRDAGFEIRFPPDGEFLTNPEALVACLQGVDAVLATTESYNEEILSRANLRAIARAGVGFDSVDLAAATRYGVAVTITPGAVEHSVAEHTMAMILGVYRDLLGRDNEVRSGQWTRAARPRLAGKALGIVGLGRIGREVAKLAGAFGLRLIAHDPFSDEAFAAEHGIGLRSLEELLAEADIVSLHVPTTEATRHVIDAETLRLMKPDALLVNTGRGPLVDEDALVAALERGHLMAAALDVFQTEPLPTDSPLLSAPRVLLTTHTAGLDEQSEIDMPRIAAGCIADLYQGRWPAACVVNPEVRDRWKW